MKAIVVAAPHHLELRELPIPVPGRGQVRIRTAACGICATDLVMIAGDQRVSMPAILGHEWSGVVDGVGEAVDAGLVGRKCVAENVLSDGGEVGFEYPGGYAEYFITQADCLYFLPEGIAFPAAALIEPLAVSVRGLRRLQAEKQDNALILGDGPLGLILLMMLKRAGYRDVFLVGGRDHRLNLALEWGASQVINYHACTGALSEAILHKHGGLFDNVIEASGSAAAMQASLQVAAPRGHILILGDYGQARADFRWNHLLHQELHITGSNASQGAWEEAVRLAGEGQMPLEKLVTHCYPVGDYKQAFETVRRRDEAVIKVVMTWH